MSCGKYPGKSICKICPQNMIYHLLNCNQTKKTDLPPIKTLKSTTLKLLFKAFFLTQAVRIFLSHYLQGLDATRKKILPDAILHLVITSEQKIHTLFWVMVRNSRNNH